MTSVSTQSATLTHHRRELPSLTGVRFLAAFYVVLFHGAPWLRSRFSLPRFLQIFLGNGYMAVGLFFILSGFILAYTYEGQIEGTARRLRFWEARFARIYPVYFLSLVLAYWFERQLSRSAQLAVLFMVQAWNPAKPGLNGAWNYPAWSLSVEIFFYVCFPFVLPWMSRRSPRVLKIMVVTLAAVCVLSHSSLQGLGLTDRTALLVRFIPLPLLRLPEFLLGMAIGLEVLRGYSSGGLSGGYWSGTVAVAAIFVLLSIPAGSWVSLVVIPFAVFVRELAFGTNAWAKALSSRSMVILGSASYAVYLLQFPVRSWVRVLFLRLPDRLQESGAPLTPLILVMFSILVFYVWEEPWRKTIRAWFTGLSVRWEKLSSKPERTIERV